MSKEYNLSTKHAVDEVVEHVILEKKNLIKGHHNHFLPQKKVKKSTTPPASFRFLIVGYSIIGFEIWLLYKGLTEWNLA